MGSDRVFFGVSAVLFALSVALTIVLCAPMQSMSGMRMPGGWTMSMMWMRMPGQSWPGSAAIFVAMWTGMMVAMMLPSLVPALRRFRVRIGETPQRGVLTAVAGAGYFFVWTVVGVVVFGSGVALASVEMRYAALSRAVPVCGAVVVAMAVAVQFTKWKRRRLSRCCEMDQHLIPATSVAAFRHGITLGLRCVACCANWTAILLVAGVMDFAAMAVVTAAITVERLSFLAQG